MQVVHTEVLARGRALHAGGHGPGGEADRAVALPAVWAKTAMGPETGAPLPGHDPASALTIRSALTLANWRLDTG
jgi:hypothetical protein